MTVKVLIIDPDISFTVPVKRALEISGNYKVDVFASGRPALEVLQRDPHDVAILDFGVDDMDMPGLIQAIRDIQPWIFVLVTPRTSAQIEQVSTLDVQGSITKPYFARQIGPVIREAALARARYTRSQPEPPAMTEPDAPTEPSIRPDDTFRRVVATLHTEDHPSGEPPVPPIEALPIPDDTTLRELVSGIPRSAPPGATPPRAVRPESLPEPPPEPPPAPPDVTTFAAIALEVADDATVPLEQLSRALSDRAESLPPETRPTIQPLPPWVPETTPDESTLVGNAVPAESAAAPAAAPATAAPATDSGALEADGAQPLDAEMAETFAGLLPPEERSPTEGAAEAPSQAAAPPADRPAEPAAAVAALALDLTQLTVESAAQSSVLSRDGELIAKTGALSIRDVKALLEEIAHIWQASEPTPPPGGGAPPRPARFRYVQLPGGGDYLMYSARTVEDMILTMLFPGDIPLKTIRRQAAQLLEALERVPEAEAESTPAAESEAATTLPSRPTEPHPPAGLREALGAPEGVEAVEAAGEAEAQPPAEAPAVERTSYAFAWLPRQDELPGAIVAMLPGWLEAIAAEHGWELDGAEAQPTYVTVQIHIPSTEAPAAAVHALMRETALRSEDAALWADPSYIVSPARDVTQQEIAAFIEYRRESQSAS